LVGRPEALPEAGKACNGDEETVEETPFHKRDATDVGDEEASLAG